MGDAGSGIDGLVKGLESVGNTRALKTLGIDADAVKQKFAELEFMGESKSQAWSDAVLSVAGAMADKLAPSIDNGPGAAMDRLQAKWDAWKTGVGKTVATTLENASGTIEMMQSSGAAFGQAIATVLLQKAEGIGVNIVTGMSTSPEIQAQFATHDYSHTPISTGGSFNDTQTEAAPLLEAWNGITSGLQSVSDSIKAAAAGPYANTPGYGTLRMGGITEGDSLDQILHHDGFNGSSQWAAGSGANSSMSDATAELLSNDMVLLKNSFDQGLITQQQYTEAIAQVKANPSIFGTPDPNAHEAIDHAMGGSGDMGGKLGQRQFDALEGMLKTGIQNGLIDPARTFATNMQNAAVETNGFNTVVNAAKGVWNDITDKVHTSMTDLASALHQNATFADAFGTRPQTEIESGTASSLDAGLSQARADLQVRDKGNPKQLAIDEAAFDKAAADAKQDFALKTGAATEKSIAFAQASDAAKLALDKGKITVGQYTLEMYNLMTMTQNTKTSMSDLANFQSKMDQGKLEENDPKGKADADRRMRQLGMDPSRPGYADQTYGPDPNKTNPLDSASSADPLGLGAQQKKISDTTTLYDKMKSAAVTDISGINGAVAGAGTVTLGWGAINWLTTQGMQQNLQATAGDKGVGSVINAVTSAQNKLRDLKTQYTGMIGTVMSIDVNVKPAAGGGPDRPGVQYQ